MFERFDENARRALFFARYDATQFGHLSIEPAHLATGAIRSVDARQLSPLIDRLRQIPGWMGSTETPLQTEIPFSAASRAVLDQAASLADRFGHRSIRPAHLLAAVMIDTSSPVSIVLRDLGVDADRLIADASTDPAPDAALVTGTSVERDTVVSRVEITNGLEADTAADERQIRAVADQLFISTDQKAWPEARALFADGDIAVDMTSLAGGVPLRMTADDLIAGFRAGLHAGKTSHHLVANCQVTVDRSGDRASLFAHGYAWNRVASLPPGEDLWETWGTYRLSFRRIDGRWSIDGFRYDSKLTRGNDAVRTHTEAG